mgnify:FL=1|tara:strand:+ start:12 stop:674 length:663 start_codon:yes stop_codon:yes gene_type:complete
MTAKIKLNSASGGGSVSIQAPSSSSNNRVISLPDIADGTLVTSQSTLDATKLSGDLPAISGANLTGISAGLSMVDCWGVSSGANYASNNHITNNWVRRTGTHGGNVGSAMTESSGVFGFPQTGLYLIMMQFGFYAYSGGQNYAGVKMDLSTDSGSSFSSAVSTFYTSMDNSAYGRLIAQETLDVTTTNIRIKFQLELQNNISLQSGQGRTSVIFIRYGDT